MNELEALTDEQRSQLLKTRRRVIESIGKNMDLYGITLSIGHLYGNMYFNREPVTLDEMSQTMGMSKTSMSTGMRTLHDLKMINKVWGKGSRKDLYEVVPDWHQNFADYFSIKWRKAVEQNMSALGRSLKEIGDMIGQYESDEYMMSLLLSDKEKIEEALAYYKWLDRLIDSFESGEIYEFIPKEGQNGGN
jgi:Predicted transcriptional regulators